MSILSVDTIQPIGSGTSVTVNSAATLVLTNANSTGVITATSFVGSGANLTSLPAQATIANNANNRVITGGSGVNLNGESGVTYDGTNFTISSGVLKLTDESNGQQLRIGASGDFFIEHDGSHAVLKNTTGDTRIQNDNNVLITASSGGTERFKVDSSGNATVSNGNLIIGTSGKGIDFSATGNSSGTMQSELLDDYEEGLFTPSIVDGGSSLSYAIQRGSYTKIGDLVNFQIDLYVSGTANGNNLRIGGLPFTTANQSTKAFGGAFLNYSNAAFSSIGDRTLFHIVSQNTYMQLYNAVTGNVIAGNSTGVNLFTNKEICLTGSYKAL